MSALRDSIATWRPRLAKVVRTFLAWWGRSLASWLPSGIRRALGLSGDRLLLVSGASGPEMRFDSEEGTAAPLGHDEATLPKWLLVPSNVALRRRMLLPAAAEARLHDVVSFEIDRQTPFNADEVRFDVRTTGKRDDGRIVAELIVVPRSKLQEQMAGIGAHADSLAGIDVSDATGQPLRVNLLPLEERRSGRDAVRILEAGLAGLAMVLAGVLMWQTLDGKRQSVDALARIVDARVAEARPTAAAYRQLEMLRSAEDFLRRKREQAPKALAILDELSNRIPDHTFIESLSIEGEQLSLTGLSGNASSLVGLLDDSGLWRDPALAGPLQPDSRTTKDRFTLTARVATSLRTAKERGDSGADHASGN